MFTKSIEFSNVINNEDFAIPTITIVRNYWRAIRENIRSSVKVWGTATCRRMTFTLNEEEISEQSG